MNFDEWWATLSPPERRVIGEHNARFVWKEAVEMCAKVCEDVGKSAFHGCDLRFAGGPVDCAAAIRAKGQ
jgi:hypothetical protein